MIRATGEHEFKTLNEKQTHERSIHLELLVGHDLRSDLSITAAIAINLAESMGWDFELKVQDGVYTFKRLVEPFSAIKEATKAADKDLVALKRVLKAKRKKK